MRAYDGCSLQFAVVALCLAVCGLSTAACAQDCVACAPSQALLASPATAWTFRREVSEVQVLFTAFRHGKFVNGLARQDVLVRDNGKPAEILDFRDHDDLPLRIAVLVDTSDSIRNRFRFEQEAVRLFLHQALRSGADQAMVAGFSTSFNVQQEFTHDAGLLAAGIAGLAPKGGTSVYDAVARACRMLVPPDRGMVARVIVLVSDGDDNSSRIPRDSAIAMAQQAEATIYAVSTDYSLSNPSGDQNLKRLAEETGGQALFPESARRLAGAFARISDELRHRYAVAYRPPEFAANGRFHRVQIQARKSGKKLKVRARKGYYAR